MSNITVSRASRTSWDHVLQGDPIKISIWMHHICCFAMQLANSSTYSLESTEISLSDCLLYLFRSASPSPSFSPSPCSSSCWRRSSPRPPSWSPSSASSSSSPWSWTPSGRSHAPPPCLMWMFQYLCDGGGAQHSLPLPADPHHGALDQESLHTHPAPAPGHAEAATQEPHVSRNIMF